MITREQLDSVLSPLGFSIHHYNGSENPTYINDKGINISINLKDNSFRIRCYISSLFILDSQLASPFISDEYNQFIKYYTKFNSILSKINS